MPLPKKLSLTILLLYTCVYLNIPDPMPALLTMIKGPPFRKFISVSCIDRYYGSILIILTSRYWICIRKGFLSLSSSGFVYVNLGATTNYHWSGQGQKSDADQIEKLWNRAIKGNSWLIKHMVGRQTNLAHEVLYRVSQK